MEISGRILSQDEVIELLNAANKRADEANKRAKEVEKQKEEADRRAKEAEKEKEEADRRAKEAEKEKEDAEEQVVNERKRRLDAENDVAVYKRRWTGSRFMHTSQANVLNDFISASTSKYVDQMAHFGIFDLNLQEEQEMLDCWNQFKCIKITGDGTREIGEMHPYMAKCFEIIMSAPSISSRLSYHRETCIPYPQYRIDGTVSGPQIEKATVETIVLPCEYKPIKDSEISKGQGQAISYLTACTMPIAEQERGLTPRFSLFSNGQMIRFFRYRDDNLEQGEYTPMFTLSAPLIDTAEQPITDGFKWLFSVMLTLAKSARILTIKVNNDIYTVVSVLQKRAISVYIVKSRGQRYVVKINELNDYDCQQWIKNEKLAYELFSNVENLNLLTYHMDLSSSNSLVLSPVCKPILEYAIEVKDEPIVAGPDFVKLFIIAVTQLEYLHNAGYCHGDISPPNIVIKKDPLKLYFIDFQHAIAKGHHPVFDDSQSFFASDSFHSSRFPRCYNYGAFDDMESLIYSFAFSIIGLTPFSLAEKETMPVVRRNLIINAVDDTATGALVKRFYLALLELDQQKAAAKPLDYDRLRQVANMLD